MAYTYAQFRAGPPRRIMAALGPIFLEALEVMSTYASFRTGIIALNDADRGCFVKAARRYAGVCSPGERELLKGGAAQGDPGKRVPLVPLCHSTRQIIPLWTNYDGSAI